MILILSLISEFFSSKVKIKHYSVKRIIQVFYLYESTIQYILQITKKYTTSIKIPNWNFLAKH